MRHLNAFLCVLLTLFTIVQYNDPDAPLWILIYGLPAIWAGLAAYRPDVFAHNEWLLGVLGLNLLGIEAVGGLPVAHRNLHLVGKGGGSRGLGADHHNPQPFRCWVHSLALAAR